MRSREPFLGSDTGHQLGLFTEAPSEKSPHGFPPIRRGPEAVRDIINRQDGPLGVDLEFNSKSLRPFILGVASSDAAAACYWDDPLGRSLMNREQRFVAYAGMSSDKVVLDSLYGASDPRQWDDPMILHYMGNQDLLRKSSEKDEDDDGARGYMNLWSAASLTTLLPYWKDCTEKGGCSQPCRHCDPLGYCATDAWAGLAVHNAYPGERSLPLYRELVDQSWLCWLMEDQGVKVNRAAIENLNQNFTQKKSDLYPYQVSYRGSLRSPEEILCQFPKANLEGLTKHYLGTYNPRSAQQAREFFSQRGIQMPDTLIPTVTKLLLQEIRKLKWRQPDTTADIQVTAERMLETLPEQHVTKEFARYWLFKASGKGLSSWCDDTYIDRNDLLHPRWITTGTSTGRLASSRPNAQNWPRQGWGSVVRHVIVPRSSSMKLLKGDASQLELRTCLFASGIDPWDIGQDAFQWLLETAPEMGSRDIAKSVCHAGNYLEGLRLLSPADLSSSMTKREIAAGALRVHKDWTYCDKIVSFTGINLADRLYGTHGYDDRRNALAIQEVYFSRFSQIRAWQKRVSAEVESRNQIQSRSGRYLRLMGRPEDDLKAAVAFIGQGSGADFVQDGMMRLWRSVNIVPILQVHDEIVLEVPKDLTNAQCIDILQLMEGAGTRIPDFRCPYRFYSGDTWGDMREIVRAG